MANSDIHWMEPKDLSFADMDFHINGKPGNSISSGHVSGAAVVFANDHEARGANVVFVNGVQPYLRRNLPPEAVRALLTIDGGEDV